MLRTIALPFAMAATLMTVLLAAAFSATFIVLILALRGAGLYLASDFLSWFTTQVLEGMLYFLHDIDNWMEEGEV